MALVGLESDEENNLGSWQDTFDGLMSWQLSNGMPMHVIKGPENFQEQMRWARNAEEALLACGFAIACCTKRKRRIEWPEVTSFGDMINRLRGQRTGPDNTLAMDCLGFVFANGQVMYLLDLFRANIECCEFEDAQFDYAYLMRANMVHSNIRNANFMGADLSGADLTGSDATRAHFYEATLSRAKLRDAILAGVDLSRANSAQANLQKARGGAKVRTSRRVK